MLGGRWLGREGAISIRGTKPRRRGAGRGERFGPWRNFRACLLCSVAAISGGLASVLPAAAQDQADYIRNTFGEVGILDMPSGHVANDGELAFTVGDIGKTQRYSLSFQFFPWLESSFRYSHVVGRLNGYENEHYYDRSFGAKIRLAKEAALTPDVSVGIRDVLGTGVYSSEYLVASKHVGPLDLTAGMGWGRLADTNALPNPLGYIFSSFNTRTSSFVGTGGVVNVKQFFHGPKVGLFGGVIWQTPINGLSLLAEYSSDRYVADGRFRNGTVVRSPVNLGLSYNVSDALSLSGGWFYGSTYGFRVTVRGDTTETARSALRVGPPIPPAIIRTDVEQQSALSIMQNRNAYVATTRAGGPWVHVATEAERTSQDLIQALLSEGRGVRNVDVVGSTLVIDARSLGDAHAQCARYAEIASSVVTHASSIAMTDLQNSTGFVTLCPVALPARYAQNDVQNNTASDGSTRSMNDQAALERTLRADLAKQDLAIDALSIGPSELWIYYENGRYQEEAEAAGRVIRVLMADAPPSIELLHVIPTISGIPRQEISIARSALERITLAHATTSGVGNAITLSDPPLDNPALDRAASDLYPSFYWSIDPKLTEHVFNPNKPLQFKLFADAEAGVVLAPGLSIGAGLTANIWNDYIFRASAGSALPHVRTDLLQYAKFGANGISGLLVDYQKRLTRDMFADVKAGYLEDMFMGAGGQLLWRPEDSRIALGLDFYQVWQRNFDRLFGLRNYQVFTGHATVYYRSPWYGLNFHVHVGRYLAGDYGATFEVTRRFSTGVEIGAYATFTNVPFRKFGEGSFDKGIIVQIPFEWALPLFSQSAYNLRLSALTRDGGQRLENDDSLYWTTRGTSYGEISEHFDDLVDP